jgi:hypothetical protein
VIAVAIVLLALAIFGAIIAGIILYRGGLW